MNENAIDTKTQIFNTALRMFAINGYENVSIRTLADAVGIKTASIYYHYSNKEQILEACYKFFVEHRYETRLKREEYEKILKKGTKKEVLGVLNYSFPEEILENMLLSLLTIFSRMYTDERARLIYIDEINNSMKYLKEFFTAGIKIGRFRRFNINAVALIFLSSRMFVAQSITIRPEEKNEWSKAEVEIIDELLNILPFIY